MIAINSSNSSENSIDVIDECGLTDHFSSDTDGSNTGSSNNSSVDESEVQDQPCYLDIDNKDCSIACYNDDGIFEGPEKTIEVVFSAVDNANQYTLRDMNREQLDELCKLAGCEIMSKSSNDYFDAYVLSESSLFVYEKKVMMKTCGTTTVLFCLAQLYEYALALGLQLAWVGYYRKNLQFPDAQKWPHSNFDDEIGYLNDTLTDMMGQKESDLIRSHLLRGDGYILGPIQSDHFKVYSTNAMTIPPSLSGVSTNNVTLNMMMFDMDPSVAKLFFTNEYPSAEMMGRVSGIHKLVPAADLDEAKFEPCGYSMNGMVDDAYVTIHVTPEEACSYASFETNANLETLGCNVRSPHSVGSDISDELSYVDIITKVLKVFQPKRFLLNFYGCSDGVLSASTSPSASYSLKQIKVNESSSYAQKRSNMAVIGSDLVCASMNFEAFDK